MRPSRERREFVSSEYPKAFLNVLDKLRTAMVNHKGREGPTTCRKFTVELTYFFTKISETNRDAIDEEEVVLNVSHNATKQFTKTHFGGEADKPNKYRDLKKEIDQISASHSRKASLQQLSSVTRPDGVNVFDEVRKVLDSLDCTLENPLVSDIRHGTKFKGEFQGTKFMFNVFTRKQGRLNTTGRLSVTWDYPKIPPAELKCEIDKVIEWVKSAEEGVLTSEEIVAGPKVDDGLNDLTSEFSGFNI